MDQTPCSPDLVESFYRTYNDTAGLRSDVLARCAAIADALRACGETDPRYRAWSLLFEGILAQERDRDWGRGERLFRAALAAAGSDPLLEARAALALSVTCNYLDRWAESIAYGRQALAALDGLDKPIDIAATWLSMAVACSSGYRAGAFGAQALEDGVGFCREALAVLDASPSTAERASLEASVYNTLGNLHNHARAWEPALAAYRRHLAICESAGYVCRTGASHDNLGAIYEQMGPDHFDRASECYHRALGIYQECRDTYEETLVWLNLASLEAAQGRLEQALAHDLRAIELIEELRAGVTTAEARAGYFATTTNAYARAVLLAADLGDVALAFDLAERSRSRAFLDTLFADSGELQRQEEAEVLSLDEVQRRLAPDALLLACFTAGVMETREGGARRATPERRHFPAARTLLFAVTHDSVMRYDAGLSPNDLMPRQLQAAAERHFLQPAIRRTLFDRLIAPVAAQLASCRRLYIVPHGPLHYVPFQALLAADGEPLLREGGPELVYGPSASVLFREPRIAPVEAAPLACLALGYNGDGPRALRFAEEEARRIARLTGGEAVVGLAPKKAALTGASLTCRWLHISCHGEFDPDAPLNSTLLLGPDETLAGGEVMAGLRLHCELATLSACESGLSRVRRGDELMGLARAFMVAGAPALVVSLWRVDERSTHILMLRFYAGLQGGLNAATALKQAQLFVRDLSRQDALALLGEAPELAAGHPADRPFADPFHWAPFILIGAAG